MEEQPIVPTEQARFRIKTQGGEVEVAGPLDFVQTKWNDVHAVLNRVGDRVSVEVVPQIEVSDQSSLPQASRRSLGKKRTGPSCASRILILLDEGFFDTPKKAGEIGARLVEKATPYEGKHVAAALNHLTKSGRLRRLKSDGDWSYIKP